MPADLVTAAFKEAAADYRYLIERGYSRKSSLKITGDRYALTACVRTLLYRGVLPRDESDRRRGLLVSSHSVDTLTVDGYNVLVTLANYLYGRPVFLGTDGFLRDAGEAYGRMIRGPMFDRAIRLFISYLAAEDHHFVRVLFDRPVPKSGELSERLRTAMEERAIHGTAGTVRSPDYELKQVTGGAVCTSDSAIIDDARVSVCDVAREILDHSFNPDYINLADLFPSD